MVEKNKGDEEAQDVPIIRINGPERTPAKAMIEQCHTMLLKSGTKMAMTAYAQRIERKHQEAEEKSKKSEKKPVAKKKPKKAKTPKK